MMLTDVKCPYCKEIQSDCTNGGDPREWWGNDYIPDGVCETECDSCRKEFEVIVDWAPCFEAAEIEEKPND